MSAATVLANATTDVTDWAKSPFSTDMDLLHWGLFTGLVIVLAVMWHIVLRDLHNV